MVFLWKYKQYTAQTGQFQKSLRIHMKFVSLDWFDKNYYLLFQMNYNASFISRISYGADWSWWKDHKTGWVLWCFVRFILISKIQNSFWDRMKKATEIHCSCVMKGQLYIFFKVTFFSRCRTVLFQYDRHHIGKNYGFLSCKNLFCKLPP